LFHKFADTSELPSAIPRILLAHWHSLAKKPPEGFEPSTCWYFTDAICLWQIASSAECDGKCFWHFPSMLRKSVLHFS